MQNYGIRHVERHTARIFRTDVRAEQTLFAYLDVIPAASIVTFHVNVGDVKTDGGVIWSNNRPGAVEIMTVRVRVIWRS
jgi:hypothetical protein